MQEYFPGEVPLVTFGVRDPGPKYGIEDRLIDFGVQITDASSRLPSTRAGSHIAGQIIRSGLSPAPNYAEAHAAESVADFIHKINSTL